MHQTFMVCNLGATIRHIRKGDLDKAAKEAVEFDKDMHPENEDMSMANAIFCFAAFAEKGNGPVYNIATDALPVMSMNGHQYSVVAFEYDNKSLTPWQ